MSLTDSTAALVTLLAEDLEKDEQQELASVRKNEIVHSPRTNDETYNPKQDLTKHVLSRNYEATSIKYRVVEFKDRRVRPYLARVCTPFGVFHGEYEKDVVHAELSAAYTAMWSMARQAQFERALRLKQEVDNSMEQHIDALIDSYVPPKPKRFSLPNSPRYRGATNSNNENETENNRKILISSMSSAVLRSKNPRRRLSVQELGMLDSDDDNTPREKTFTQETRGILKKQVHFESLAEENTDEYAKAL